MANRTLAYDLEWLLLFAESAKVPVEISRDGEKVTAQIILSGDAAPILVSQRRTAREAVRALRDCVQDEYELRLKRKARRQ